MSDYQIHVSGLLGHSEACSWLHAEWGEAAAWWQRPNDPSPEEVARILAGRAKWRQGILAGRQDEARLKANRAEEAQDPLSSVSGI